MQCKPFENLDETLAFRRKQISEMFAFKTLVISLLQREPPPHGTLSEPLSRISVYSLPVR